MNKNKFDQVLNTTTDTILDYKGGSIVYVRKGGTIVAARIEDATTIIVFDGVNQDRDKVSTSINLQLATGDPLYIDEYSEYNKGTRLYSSVENCTHDLPIKQASRGHVNFALRVYKAFGMTPQWYGHVLCGCPLYIKRATKVDKTSYNGLIYHHGNVEGISFTTAYFHRAGSGYRSPINGTYEYLNLKYNLYATEEGAYDALKPKVITFPCEDKKTSLKSTMRAEIEMWLHELAEGTCVFASVTPPVSLVPAYDEKRNKNTTAIAVTLQASDEPCVLTTEGEVIPLQNLSEESVARIHEFVDEDYHS